MSDLGNVLRAANPRVSHVCPGRTGKCAYEAPWAWVAAMLPITEITELTGVRA
jgi:hypothetical protein